MISFVYNSISWDNEIARHEAHVNLYWMLGKTLRMIHFMEYPYASSRQYFSEPVHMLHY